MENTAAIKETFDYLYLHEKNLSLAQKDFIASLKKYYIRNKQLSEKQQITLFEIKKYLNVSDQQVRFSRAEVRQASGMKTEGLKY